MSKYAKLNLENIVENVIECEDSKINLLEGIFVKIQNHHDSGCGVGIGDEYFPNLDKFKEKQWWDSWTWNEELWKYVPPTPKPSTGKWLWSELSQDWLEVVPTEVITEE